MQKFRLTIFVLLAVALWGCSGGSNAPTDQALLRAQEMLWQDAQSTRTMLAAIDRESLSDADLHMLRVTEAHAYLKTEQRLPADADLEEDGRWLERHGQKDKAGEAYYVLGTYENLRGDNYDAMEHLKHAERLLSGGITLGMAYYKMGRISESEQLYEVATHYYEQAVPYMREADLPLYAASAYRELGRTTVDTTAEQTLRRSYFEEALRYAQRTQDTLLYLDILYAEKAMLEPGSKEIAAISRYLCDSAGIHRYAHDVVKDYLQRGRADSAAHYLEILAKDTALLAWTRDRYTLLLSQYNHLTHRDREAYETLLRLYNRLSDEIEETGKSRTFAIAQRYDNEAEKARNLQLELDKQRLYFTLTIVLFVVLTLGIIMLVLGSRRKTRQMLEKAEQEQRIESLRRDLQLRREALRRVLEQRLVLTKNLQEALLHHQEEGEVPRWAQEFVETNILATDEQWRELTSEANGCYGQILDRLHRDYPALTPNDMQVIALTLLGLDISDICLLLGLTQRTVWSRRQRIKGRIGLTTEDLDEWLRAKVEEE